MYVVFNQEDEPVLCESAEVSSHDTFGGTDGTGDATGFNTRASRDVREHHEVLAMPALH